MPINKTQQFLYFQNKAKHYDTIRHIKSSVQDKLQPRYLKNLSLTQRSSQKKNKKPRLIPIMRQIQIKQENENMINRLVRMLKSQRTEVQVQGNYSRFNKQQRKFRSLNPFKDQLNRTIQIENEQHQNRIKRTKPRVGSSLEWNQHFGKTLQTKRNMSRYLLEQNRSKASLHISVVDSFVPKYYETFLNTIEVTSKEKGKSLPKEIEITREGLLVLPDIKGNDGGRELNVRHSKDNRKLIFDRSIASLHSGNNNKSQESLGSLVSSGNSNSQNPQKQIESKDRKQKNSPQKYLESKEKGQKTERRRLLEFKFSQVNSESKKARQLKPANSLQLKQSILKESTEKDKQTFLDLKLQQKTEVKELQKHTQDLRQHVQGSHEPQANKN